MSQADPSTSPDSWELRLAELESTRAQLYAYAVDLRRTMALERARRRELEQAYVSIISTLANAVGARDTYTGDHAIRVAAYAAALTGALGWSDAETEEARIGGLLHDIGKLAVDDAVLRKPGRLDEAEWQQMRSHPEAGGQILRGAPFLARAAVYAQHHHERWDGAGYPARLAGSDIPMGGRLLAVVDAFDAMTSSRPYRSAMDPEAAAAEVTRCSGTQFDPEIAQAFLKALLDGRIPLPDASTPRAAAAA